MATAGHLALISLFCILLNEPIFSSGAFLHLSYDLAQAKKVSSSLTKRKLLGVVVDASSSRRELAGARTTAHDVFAPVTNPVTVPATNPATNPVSPGIVTVPSTNPGTGFATNPNLPPLYPEPTTPVTMPDPTTMPTPTTMPSPVTTPAPLMNPVTAPTMPSPVTNPTAPVTNPTAPVTNPTAPVTNPVTTPTPLPGSSPVTNPVTTYPYPPQGGGGVGGMPTTPVYQPPTTMPGTVQPAAPTVSGQTWCVAKAGLMDTALQSGLDYACGMGAADCSALQPMGSCYNPNTLQAHASYAFNSYFQRNPSPASCDFGGAGMLVSTNPSSGTCMYQTSSAGPAVTGTGPTGAATGMGGAVPVTGTGPAVGGGSGSTVLTNNPGGNSIYGGSDNTTGLTTDGAASRSCGWVLCLIWIFTIAYVKEKV